MEGILLFIQVSVTTEMSGWDVSRCRASAAYFAGGLRLRTFQVWTWREVVESFPDPFEDEVSLPPVVGVLGTFAVLLAFAAKDAVVLALAPGFEACQAVLGLLVLELDS